MVLISLSFMSCSETGNGDVEYIPFKETIDGQWGMISMDGKVLFKEEFKDEPTVVRDGRFFVRNKDGFWEMYDATRNPKKIGSDYAHTSGFRNGRALVAVKNQAVSIIDTDGKEIKKLDIIKGKEVAGVRTFSEDYAVFMTTDSLYGVIDNNGKCIVKPEYYSLSDCSDGKFIGVNNKYREDVENGEKGKCKISVINTSGKIPFEFAADKYEKIHDGFTDGKLAVSVKKDGEEIWGIINDKGETVVTPSAKLKDIGTISGDIFTYNNGDGWGLMNIKGETLIRAKYVDLFINDENLLVAVVNNGNSCEFKYIDQEDNQIGSDTYLSASLFTMFDGKHALVMPNDKFYSIIDRKGKHLKGLPDIASISTYEGESYIESDYVDLEKLVEGFNITQDGLIGLTFKSTPQDAVKVKVENGSAFGDEKHSKGSPYWYINDSNISIGTNDVVGVMTIDFSGNLSRQTYRTERIIDYCYGNWYWYHDKRIPTGYVWNKVKPELFNLTINNYGRMHGKLRDLFRILYNKFKNMGKVEKENNSAAVISLKNGMLATIIMHEGEVHASWGNMHKTAKDIDISEYKDASERYISDFYSLHELFLPAFDPSPLMISRLNRQFYSY